MSHKSKVIEGALDARGAKFAIVASRFNHLFVEKLVEGAISAVVRHNGIAEEQTIVWVPGAFEIPIVAQRLAQSKKYHAIICVGAVIKGDTDHYEFVMGAAERGIMQASLQTATPITTGILTVHTMEQAFERSGSKCGNVGWNAAVAAIEVTNVLRHIE